MDYNGICTKQFPVYESTAQGATGSGNNFNLGTTPAQKKGLEAVKTEVYGVNMSVVTYSDDGGKLAKSKEELQKVCTAENEGFKSVNLSVNPSKSYVVYWSRSKQKTLDTIDQMIEVSDSDNEYTNQITLDGENVPIANLKTETNGKVKMLGQKRDFNDPNDFRMYHFKDRIIIFNSVRNKLYFQRIIGDRMALQIQTQMYVIKIRSAIIFGLTTVGMVKKHYKEIDSERCVYDMFLRTNNFSESANFTNVESVGRHPLYEAWVKALARMFAESAVRFKRYLKHGKCVPKSKRERLKNKLLKMEQKV